MRIVKAKLSCIGVLLLGLPLLYSSSVFAATPVDLNHQSPFKLESLIQSSDITAPVNLKSFRVVNKNVDANGISHVRLQQEYQGIRVYGADVVMHLDPTPPGTFNIRSDRTMNGTAYKDLADDLTIAPEKVFTKDNAAKLLNIAIMTYQNSVGGKPEITHQEMEKMVFIDDANKAHWAYKISFRAEPMRDDMMPADPVYIVDAITDETYREWNNLKTSEPAPAVVLQPVTGGGYGGNLKMGKIMYGDMYGSAGVLHFMRDPVNAFCYLSNSDVKIMSFANKAVSKFDCAKKNPKYHAFFSADLDAVNGGYSPDNDALFGGQVVKKMYREWYGIPALVEKDNKTPMLLSMLVHMKVDNAYWDERYSIMKFGDGVQYFYPLTSLGVTAHEVSHGFTSQHSNLDYVYQSGGMNESFSDMAAQAAEFYVYGKSSWQIGNEIMKKDNASIRYMDRPSKDCHGGNPGDNCSIDNARQYTRYLDVHQSSGVYNHFFYLLSTTKNWDTKKAFDVMVQANAYYWTKSTNFATGACGVISAAKDLKYNVKDVEAAFTKIKINTADC